MRYVLYTTHIRYCVHMYSSTLSTTLYVTIVSLALALRYCILCIVLYMNVHCISIPRIRFLLILLWKEITNRILISMFLFLELYNMYPTCLHCTLYTVQ